MYACRIDERHFAHAYDANFRTISECCHDFLKLISRTKEIWSVYFVHFHILGYGVVVEIRGKKIEFFVQIYFVIGYGFHISGFRHSLHEQQTRNNKTHFYGNRQIEDYGKEKSYQKHSYIAFGVFHQSKEGPPTAHAVTYHNQNACKACHGYVFCQRHEEKENQQQNYCVDSPGYWRFPAVVNVGHGSCYCSCGRYSAEKGRRYVGKPLCHEFRIGIVVVANDTVGNGSRKL